MLDGAQKTDAALRQAVQDALTFDPRITAAHIGLTANAGIITMTGKVPSFIERYHAGQVVLGLQLQPLSTLQITELLLLQ